MSGLSRGPVPPEAAVRLAAGSAIEAAPALDGSGPWDGARDPAEMRAGETLAADAAASASALRIREVDGHEIPDWNARSVSAPGGDVYQSTVWADHWARWGWQPRYLRFDDGFPLLSLERPWPIVPGRGAYLSRGPILGGEPVERTSARLQAAYAYLSRRRVDVVASDAAIPAATGYGELIERAGFRPIDEIEPSRHRLSVALDESEDELFRAIDTTTRQRIRKAERTGLQVVRYDSRNGGESWEGFERAGVPAGEVAALTPAMDRFYRLLSVTAARRAFGVAPGARIVDWVGHAVAGGLAVYLEVRSPTDDLVAGAVFYRHGGRLTYAHSADLASARTTFPGAMNLLIWRAMQLARREGLTEFDLGGVDVAGQRTEPRPGDPMYGLYFFKRSFGGKWVELTGNHERVARPLRYLGGRLARRIVVAPGRLSAAVRGRVQSRG